MEFYMRAVKLPPQVELRQIFRYEPETGKLFWLPREGNISWNKVFGGKEAGCLDSKGYVRIRTEGRVWVAHRVIWKLVHGDDPEFIDHINGTRSDNRLENLRSVTQTENARNTARHRTNTSGCTGVFWHSRESRWYAVISVNSKRKVLGSFKDKDAAIAARKAAEQELGYHQNHGR
jgi:hypothetical protein